MPILLFQNYEIAICYTQIMPLSKWKYKANKMREILRYAAYHMPRNEFLICWDWDISMYIQLCYWGDTKWKFHLNKFAIKTRENRNTVACYSLLLLFTFYIMLSSCENLRAFFKLIFGSLKARYDLNFVYL